MKNRKFSLILTFLFVFNSIFVAQITLKELPKIDYEKINPVIFGKTTARTIIPLNENWTCYPENISQQTKVNIPCSFSGTDIFYFVTNFNLSNTQINNFAFFLNFFGISYYSEVEINDMIIFKSKGGEIPFRLKIPNEILHSEKPNNLKIKIHHNLNSKSTIPFNKNYLSPENLGGITRDVFLELVPKIHFENYDIKYSITKDNSSANLNIFFKLNDLTDNINFNSFTVDATLLNKFKQEIKSYKGVGGNFSIDKINSFNIALENPALWSPASPDYYYITLKLISSNQIIDEVTQLVSFSSKKIEEDKIYFNGKPLKILGTTYYSYDAKYKNLISYQKLVEDLKLIKNTGFNAVRFAKHLPHPFALEICQELGLLAFIELPINSIYDELCSDELFQKKAKEYLEEFIDNYGKYPSVLAIGLGSSYIPDSEEQINFINELNRLVKEKLHILTYASFVSFPQIVIDDLDFYGVEIYSKPIEQIKEELSRSIETFGKAKIFFSEITYPNYNGSTNGYENPFSLEAQAKYFSDIFTLTEEQEITTTFLNTLLQYKGDYPSLYSGFNQEGKYSISIISKQHGLNTIAYKLIKSKLISGEQVTIPIGNKDKGAPLFFILVGLLLLVLTALLINSKRKFREDVSRSLLKPYNFFSDIRDHRIFAGIHIFFMMLLLSASAALLIENILFYFRANILFDKFLLSFGSKTLIDIVGYLAWNTEMGFLILFGSIIILIILLSIIIHIFSFFIRTKILFSSIFFLLIWALVPLTLLIPIELILYRVLLENIINVYIFIFLGICFIWLIQRIIKGIYIIFDVRPIFVYLISFLLILITIGGLVFYFQLTESTIYFIVNAIKQYSFL
ncbi:MAG: hypothetical protein JW866_04905 [Ignavibacteriales bacterium]|nr:hypothetical protein [Ignavibacteriales bacterium]